MSDPREPIAALLAVMARLRDPARGCPWDLAQTFATIAPYTLEEAYEVADVIENGDVLRVAGDGTVEGDAGRQAAAARAVPAGRPAAAGAQSPDAGRLRDELGDLLFQVVFHARLAQERGWFDFGDVARAIAEKLVRRHPHVFGEVPAAIDAAALPGQWEEQKARERAEAARRRGERGSAVLADVPLALPALLRAAKLGKRAGRIGFDWPRAADVREKVVEELGELDAAVGAHAPASVGSDEPAAGAVAEELGDLLFAVANWSRHLGVEPETALRAANAKFERRFACMERLAAARGVALSALTPAEWDALWRAAKASTAPV